MTNTEIFFLTALAGIFTIHAILVTVGFILDKRDSKRRGY
jgi:hypothetical protein